MRKEKIVEKLQASIKTVFSSIYKALYDEREQQHNNIDLINLHDAKEPDESSLLYEFSVIGTSYKIEAQILHSLGRVIFLTYVLEKDKLNVDPKDVYSLLKGLTIEVYNKNEDECSDSKFILESAVAGKIRELPEIGSLYLIAFCKAIADREKEVRRRAGLD